LVHVEALVLVIRVLDQTLHHRHPMVSVGTLDVLVLQLLLLSDCFVEVSFMSPGLWRVFASTVFPIGLVDNLRV